VEVWSSTRQYGASTLGHTSNVNVKKSNTVRYHICVLPTLVTTSLRFSMTLSFSRFFGRSTVRDKPSRIYLGFLLCEAFQNLGQAIGSEWRNHHIIMVRYVIQWQSIWFISSFRFLNLELRAATARSRRHNVSFPDPVPTFGVYVRFFPCVLPAASWSRLFFKEQIRL
jgi:hypothetical protein